MFTSTSTYSKEGVESSTKANENSCTASDLLENNRVSPAQAQASTSGFGTKSETLTCPVCFRPVETTDLNVFNRHIDSCLNEAASKPKESAVSDEESDLDPENDYQECEGVHKQRGECEAEELETSQRSDSVQKVSLIKGDDKPVTSPQPRSCHGKSPVLICPVCQLIQDTHDLTVFNRHVDLCLNQGVLDELGGQTLFSINPSALKNGKTAGKREC